MLRRVFALVALGVLTATPVLSDVRIEDWVLGLPSGQAAPGQFAEIATPDFASPLAVTLPQPDMQQGLDSGSEDSDGGVVFSPERAQVLLRSLTLPGWGQASLGHETAAWVFGLVEAATWVSFSAFKIQESMRRETYERTAMLSAGISLDGRDEEFRRIVGSYLSSEEYNRLVVFRDAANLFYDDPAMYRQYIAENELKGEDAWAWSSVDELFRYRSQRQNVQRAANRANTALAVAIGNRILSAIHAARIAGTSGQERSWHLEYVPDVEDPTAFRVGVTKNF